MKLKIIKSPKNLVKQAFKQKIFLLTLIRKYFHLQFSYGILLTKIKKEWRKK